MPLGDIVGQDFAVSSLRSALRSGKVATAYLFHGPAGVGKRTTALTFAKALNCIQSAEDACEKCSSCRRIERGTHPDVLTVGLLAGKTRLLIEQIKEVERELMFAPYEAGRRVVIVEQAELMSPEAAGAILKTLEEPPEGTVFLLLTERPAALAPTILSRCQSLRFAPLRPETIQTFLEESGASPPLAKLASRFAQGSLERALGIDHEDFLQRRKRLLELFREASLNNIAHLSEATTELVSQRGRDAAAKERRRQKVGETLEIMLSLCRDILLARDGASRELLVNEDLADEIGAEAARLSLEQAQDMVQAALSAARRVERNVAPEGAFEAMLLQLAAVRAVGVPFS